MRYIKNLIIMFVCLFVVLVTNTKVFAVEDDCNNLQGLYVPNGVERVE